MPDPWAIAAFLFVLIISSFAIGVAVGYRLGVC